MFILGFNVIICFNYNQETSIFLAILLALYHGPQEHAIKHFISMVTLRIERDCQKRELRKGIRRNQDRNIAVKSTFKRKTSSRG